VTGKNTKAPVRVLKNKMALEYIRLTSEKDIPLLELEKLTLGSLKKAVYDGNLDEGSFMAGQITGLIKEIKPVQQILDEMFLPIKDYQKTIKVI
jgi:enoyl-[acyl-carrier protein] reductase II